MIDPVKDYLKAIGSKGGSAGKGERKARNRAHYVEAGKRSAMARKLKKESNSDSVKPGNIAKS